MAKKQTNDSPAQKKAKQQNKKLQNDNTIGNRHTEGVNHPAT